MDGIRLQYPQPRNEHEFLRFSVWLHRRMWNRPKLEPYGHDGEEQFGVDIFEPSGTKPGWASQCKSREAWKTLQPNAIREEVEKAKSFPHKLDRYTIITSAKHRSWSAQVPCRGRKSGSDIVFMRSRRSCRA